MAVVSVKVQDDTKVLWVEAAEAAGMSLSEWVKRQCGVALAREHVATTAMIRPRLPVEFEFRGPDPKPSQRKK